MSNAKAKNNNYVINDLTGIGNIKVSHEVVMTIAAVAALEVKGVYSMQGKAANEIVTMLGMKNLSQGVRVEISENTAKVTLAIILEYGCSIPKVSAQVQDKVKTSLETMTGLVVTNVNVRIAGVNIDKYN